MFPDTFDFFRGTHLSVPFWMSGHYLYCNVEHETRSITLYDPYPVESAFRGSAEAGATELGKLLDKKRKEAFRALRSAHQLHYTISWYQPPLPRQNDTVSCGVFVCAFAYFLRFHGRPPTPADFNGGDHHALRLGIFKALESGVILPPPPPHPPLAAAAGLPPGPPADAPAYKRAKISLGS
jgi:hypothetical protein